MLLSTARLILSALCVLTAASCTPYVQTNTIASYEPDYQLGGSIAVVPFKPELLQSESFALYRQKVEDQLLRTGFEISSNPEDVQQVAIISYGVDPEQTKKVITMTGAPSPEGRVGRQRSHILSTIYQRVFAMDIVDTLSMKLGNPEVLFEIRTTSEGTCVLIDKVIGDLIEATFTEFPPVNGKVVNRKINSTVDC